MWGVSTDPFSDVLQLTQARSVLSGGFSASGTWAIRFPPPREIKFSVIARGGCWLRLDGHKKAIRVEQGDIGLLPGRNGYVIGSDLAAPPRDAERFFGKRVGPFAKIGDGSDFMVLAGGVSLHPSAANVLTRALPAIIHIRAASPRAAALRWIVEQILEERDSTLAGASLASAQLAGLLFTQVLRAHLASSGTLPAGWLRAMRDERIAPALRRIHDEPGRAWTLEDLAKSAAMSRTSFAVHFKTVAGVPPLTYLTEWRMRLAQKSLGEDDAAVSEIASSLGYASESAFSQAFKRVTGSRPRDFRNAMKQAEPTQSHRF